ncbi:MAG: UDP-N-acetylmuramate dehydrogenase [Methylacidiphilales bacterium]|nr:UDP-N-acetylmuramate dehydrogenase [Candidatus Methylacidiphilales bacterium]
MHTNSPLNIAQRVKQGVKLSDYTWWNVGGIADYFYEPYSVEDLQEVLLSFNTNSICWIGLGSNVLIRDGGYRGLVIRTFPGLQEIRYEKQSTVTFYAGVTCAKASKWISSVELGGIEFLCGIPGTIGGALAMNAGAQGSAIWDYVVEVSCMQSVPPFSIHRFTPDDFTIGYRSVLHKNIKAPLWFLSATLLLPYQVPEKTMSIIKSHFQKRNTTQPIGTANSGCVFKNPEGSYAGKIIDQLGLKNMRVGDATVSNQHANFIINTGKATASDIEQLILKIQDYVKDKTGVTLELEIRIIGDSV